MIILIKVQRTFAVAMKRQFKSFKKNEDFFKLKLSRASV